MWRLVDRERCGLEVVRVWDLAELGILEFKLKSDA